MAKLPPRNDGPTKFMKHGDTIYGFKDPNPVFPIPSTPMIFEGEFDQLRFCVPATHWTRPSDPSFSSPLTADERAEQEVKLQELREQLTEERLRREQEQLLAERQVARMNELTPKLKKINVNRLKKMLNADPEDRWHVPLEELTDEIITS